MPYRSEHEWRFWVLRFKFWYELGHELDAYREKKKIKRRDYQQEKYSQSHQPFSICNETKYVFPFNLGGIQSPATFHNISMH